MYGFWLWTLALAYRVALLLCITESAPLKGAYLGESLQILFPVFEDGVALIFLHQIHFMDEAKDFGFGRVLQDGL